MNHRPACSPPTSSGDQIQLDFFERSIYQSLSNGPTDHTGFTLTLESQTQVRGKYSEKSTEAAGGVSDFPEAGTDE